jgi:hypothetical protein
MTSVTSSIDPTLVISNSEAIAHTTILMLSIIALSYIIIILAKVTYYFITPVAVFSVDQIGSTITGRKPILDSPPVFKKTNKGDKSENYGKILLAVRDKDTKAPKNYTKNCLLSIVILSVVFWLILCSTIGLLVITLLGVENTIILLSFIGMLVFIKLIMNIACDQNQQVDQVNTSKREDAQ